MGAIPCPLCVVELDDECTECFGRGVISGPKQSREVRDGEYYGYERPGEIWKPYPENDTYQISNHGRILNSETGRMLKPNVNSHGYFVVRLGSSNRFVEALHRTVARLFMPDYKSKCQVTFKDGDMHNCHIDNLVQTDRFVRGKAKVRDVV